MLTPFLAAWANVRATARAELSTAVTAAAAARGGQREAARVGVEVEDARALGQRPDARARLSLVDEHAGLLARQRLHLQHDAVLDHGEGGPRLAARHARAS